MPALGLSLLLCVPLIASAASPVSFPAFPPPAYEEGAFPAETLSDIAAGRDRPPFFSAETPFQMLGMAASGVGAGMVGALIMGGILSGNEKDACREERREPDGDDFGCGLAGLDGMIKGFMIGFPLGHAAGAGLAGYVQGKRGVALAMISAVAGDFALGLLAFELHERYDGKWLANGELDPWLIYGTIVGGIAIPIATQTIYDYQVRFPLRPRIAFGPGGNTRMRMEVVQVGF